MAKIEDKVALLQAQVTRLNTAHAGLTGDIADIKAKLEALNDGTLTPAQEAALDVVIADTTALADKFTALDDETPPAPTP